MPITIPPALKSDRRRDPGSFRDPSGFVFTEEGVLYRQVNTRYRVHYDTLVSSGLAAALVSDGLLIAHEEVPLRTSADHAAYKVLRPEHVPFISYPYEWSFGQLRDAALLTLRVQARALKFGMTLKDASAYNVQFLRGTPVLIDTLSFETYTEGAPWVAYRQFCQHFLAPLALMAHCDVRLNQLLRVFIDGVPLDLAAGLLPWRTRFRPALAVHLHVHARMQKRHAQTTAGAKPAAASRPLSRTALLALLENLARAITRLEWNPAGTEWADYYSATNYSDASLDEKARLVDEMLERVQPRVVWDLGANTGRFSRIAAGKRITTIAFDMDAAAVERNYRACVADGLTHLLPLVLDLSNPSPGLGWAAGERLSITERGPADAVLALALIHHLAIGNNVPFSKIAEFFASTGRHLIIEFVPKSDSQVQRLLASREDVFDEYDQVAFQRAFAEYFTTMAVEPIAGTERTLFQMTRR